MSESRDDVRLAYAIDIKSIQLNDSIVMASP